MKCATNNDAPEPEIDAEDGLPKDLCPDSLKAHMNSAAGKGVVDDSILINLQGQVWSISVHCRNVIIGKSFCRVHILSSWSMLSSKN